MNQPTPDWEKIDSMIMTLLASKANLPNYFAASWSDLLVSDYFVAVTIPFLFKVDNPSQFSPSEINQLEVITSHGDIFAARGTVKSLHDLACDSNIISISF